ncbi:hypothetical protein VCR31J2_1280050 [Vibrio coralliirubri]|uniref:Uncharacterized protein n=1 Tax=Vibrio coralliirubri TaxID=1516159 RepID=A0AA86WP88_9VIBR|nr:hypothetical protein VCR31J2_1280050 [Vibrio coralliirubri]
MVILRHEIAQISNTLSALSKFSGLSKKYLVDSQLNALFELPWCHSRPNFKSSTKVSRIRITHNLANVLNRPVTRFQ